MKKLFLPLLCALLLIVECAVPVNAEPLQTPTLEKTGTITTYVGKTIVNPVTTDGVVTYKSSKKSVAVVNSKGEIYCKKAGTVTITVKAAIGKTFKAKTLKFKVKVKKYTPKLTTTGTIEAFVGDTVTNPVKTKGTLTYKSNKKSVATVDCNGVVTCLKPGTATITSYAKSCTKYYYKKLTYKVKVVEKPVEEINDPNGLSARRLAENGETLKILMIGNSYTYRSNDKYAGGIFGQFQQLAIDNGKNVVCDMFYRGSTSMKQFYNGALSDRAIGNVPAGVSLKNYLSTTPIRYDLVVLQYDGNGYTEEVCQIINTLQPDAEVLLYLAHRTSDFTVTSADLRERQYVQAAELCRLAGCIRFTRTIANMTTQLYAGNGSTAKTKLIADNSGHLNAAGCFAMGATLYKTIYNELPSVKKDYYFFDSLGHNYGKYAGLDYDLALKVLKCIPDNL